MKPRLSRLWRAPVVVLACLPALGLALLVAPAPARADAVERQYRAAAQAFHALRAEPAATPQGWRGVATAFDRISAAEPAHPRGADSLYSAGLALRAAEAAGGGAPAQREAVERFERFARIYAEHRLADDSMVQLAELRAAGGNEEHAYLTYRHLLAAYPNGDQAPLARQRAAAIESQVGNKSPSPPAAPSRVRVGAAHRPRVEAAETAAIQPDGEELATVKRLLFTSSPERTRVILTTSDVVDYRVEELPAREGLPRRLFFDLAATRPDSELASVHKVGDGVVEQVRVSAYTPETTRVVFDLRTLEHFEVKELRLPFEKKLIIDLFPPEGAAAITLAPAAEPVPPPRAAPTTLRNALALKVKKIVVDPGHGGHDPGAVAFGVHEKSIALKLSRMLKEVIAVERPDIAVELTREDDTYIPLGTRPALAKDMGADLFVSIHLNAHEQERFHGIETYFLNLTTDASSMRVAARENASTEKQIGDLNAILKDVLRDTNILESSKLANAVQSTIVADLRQEFPVRSLGVKQAPFMVLMGAEMPGVLVEAGFLTNRRENERLRKDAYLRRLAEGIFQGLSKYVEEQNIAAEPSTPALARRDP